MAQKKQSSHSSFKAKPVGRASHQPAMLGLMASAGARAGGTRTRMNEPPEPWVALSSRDPSGQVGAVCLRPRAKNRDSSR